MNIWFTIIRNGIIKEKKTDCCFRLKITNLKKETGRLSVDHAWEESWNITTEKLLDNNGWKTAEKLDVNPLKNLLYADFNI